MLLHPTIFLASLWSWHVNQNDPEDQTQGGDEPAFLPHTETFIVFHRLELGYGFIAFCAGFSQFRLSLAQLRLELPSSPLKSPFSL